MLTPGDFRAPRGELVDSLFPGESTGDLETRIQSYIDEAVASAEAAAIGADRMDEAIEAWVYYRVYSAVYVRMLATPSTVDMKEAGSKSSLWSQIEGFKKLADEWLGRYSVTLPVGTVSTGDVIPPTDFTANQITY